MGNKQSKKENSEERKTQKAKPKYQNNSDVSESSSEEDNPESDNPESDNELDLFEEFELLGYESGIKKELQDIVSEKEIYSREWDSNSGVQIYKITLQSGEEFALKILRWKEVRENELKDAISEYKIMQKMSEVSEFCIRPFKLAISTNHKQCEMLMEFWGGELKIGLKDAERIKEGKRYFPTGIILNLFRLGVSALAAGENQEIYHGDIKPANLLYKNGVVKIGDYGTAVRFGKLGMFKAMSFQELINDKGLSGWTPTYQPPEMVQQSKIIYLSKVDVYSMAMTIFNVINFHEHDKMTQYLHARTDPLIADRLYTSFLEEINDMQLMEEDGEVNIELTRKFIIILKGCLAYSYENRPSFANLKMIINNLEKWTPLELQKYFDSKFEEFPEKQAVIQKLEALDTKAAEYHSKSEYSLALEKYKEDLELKLSVFGITNIRIYEIYLGLATCLKELGEYEQAMFYFQKLVDFDIVNHPEENYTLWEKKAMQSNLFHNIGSLYNNLSEFTSAEEYLKKAIELRKEIYGNLHDMTAKSKSTLALMYLALSRLVEARDLLEECISICIQTVGYKNPLYSSILINLTDCCMKEGKIEEGEKHITQVLNIWGKIRNAEGKKVIRHCYQRLAQIRKQEGKMEEAVEYMEKALFILKETFGDKHPHIAETLNSLGLYKKHMGKYTEAISILRESISMTQEMVGDYTFTVAAAYYNISLAYVELENYSSALQAMNSSYDVFVKIVGEQHPQTQAALQVIDWLQGQVEDANEGTTGEQGAPEGRQEEAKETHA